MPDFPVTGSLLYDLILAAGCIIAGFGLGLKADKWWGYPIVAAGAVWGFLALRGIGLI